MNISIKTRIYWSFLLLVSLFVINVIITFVILNREKKMTRHNAEVADPSIEAIHEFRRVMRESIMFTSNYIFIRPDGEDKAALETLQTSIYPALKTELGSLSAKWYDKTLADSLKIVFKNFDQVILDEKSIMSLLQNAADYNNTPKRSEVQQKVESNLLPRIRALTNSLNRILKVEIGNRAEEEKKIANATEFLRNLIVVLAIAIVCLGLFFSIYLTRRITRPLKWIRDMISDLGKGITRKIEFNGNADEIGIMVHAVNNLAVKLQGTASFAHQTGLRNFNIPFQPLSNEDTLGKALLAMRNNLKTSEQELVDAHAEIQTIFKAALDVVIIIDEEGKIVKWDDKAESLFGWKEEEITGLSLTETIIPFRYREAHQRGMKHFLTTGDGPVLGRSIEVHALKKSNEEIDISLSISPFLIKDKYRFIGFIRDITSRKKAEAELRHTEERYRQIVETSQEGIWLIDENNKTNFVNKRLCEILGYPEAEIIGKEIYDFMDEEAKQIAVISMEKRKQGSNENLDFKYITKNGTEVWTHLATSPVLDGDGKYIGALAMVTDITRRKLDEGLLRQSEINLAAKIKELRQKNKELEQFAYIASHDLQEPLRTTSSFVELLQQQYYGQLDGQADKYLTYILQSSDRMMVLINDLLDYSRIGNIIELQRVDCNILLQEVLADLDKAIKDEQADITVEQLPVISGNRTEIKQLFQNLIINAIKFRKKESSPQINISAEKTEDGWAFAVQDNGIGIEDIHKERIFIIFQRLHTRTEYEGSGIGLAHCRKIVGLHGGKIWVESKFGEGAAFHFMIPTTNN